MHRRTREQIIAREILKLELRQAAGRSVPEKRPSAAARGAFRRRPPEPGPR